MVFMAEEPNKRKSTRRRRPEEESETGIHSVPKDLVEIERNILESWLIHLKHWVKINTEMVRKYIIGAAVLIVLIFVFVFIHSGVIEAQNRQFYQFAAKYHEIKGQPQELQAENFANLKEEADILCGTFWATKHSNNACLISGLIALETQGPQSGLEVLEEYRENLSNDALEAYFAFFNAYRYESVGESQKAIELYDLFLEKLEISENQNLGLFHKARALYNAEQYEDAKILFLKIVQEKVSSPHSAQARHYLTLIELQKQSGGSTTPDLK